LAVMAPRGGINVRVLSLDTELEFTIQSKTTGKILFDQIIQTTGLREIWYFGLQYTDQRGNTAWLNLDKKVKDQDIKKEETLQFKFRFKTYPENVAEEIIQEQTLRLLYLQIKSDILNEGVFCPPEKAVLLASYATQVKYGNYDPERNEQGYLANDNILPRSVIVEHKLSREEWEEKVSIFHGKHKGMSKEEGMLEYLKVAQDLETYGISYFEVKNKKGTLTQLGLDALGINIYPKDSKLNPEINFPWSEIRRISYSGDKFIVKLTTKATPKFIAQCTVPKQSKRIYDLASNNHEMYMRRRRPDTLEVQQMKSQKQDQLAAKAKEKEELQKEVAARTRAEQDRQKLELKYKEMEARIEKRDMELSAANKKIEDLENQLRQLQDAKAELEEQQEQLRTMMEELENAKNLEFEQRNKMEEEIRDKQEEIETIRNQVAEREAESARLQEEVSEARAAMERNEEELKLQLETARMERYSYGNGTSAPSMSGESSAPSEEMGGADDDEEDGEMAEPLSIPEIMVDPVEERKVEMKDDMKDTLAELEQSLAKERELDNKMADQHRDNLRRGQDKYKTLREVRKGNTKRRIDNFENM